MRVVPAPELSVRQFRSTLELLRREEHAAIPDLEPMTEQELRLRIADDHSRGNHHERFAVVEDDVVLSFAELELEQDPANQHFASAEIAGISTQPTAAARALAIALERCAAAGRTTVMGWGADTPVHDQFWATRGAPCTYRERISALDVPAVDTALIRSWIDAHHDRAGDIELVRWRGPCPEANIAAFAASRTTMNDAPRQGLDLNDEVVSIDDVRRDEASAIARGFEALTILALDPDGNPVGHTDIQVNTLRPSDSWQGDTVVRREHRHRGIGRWLKAEAWQWLREVAPDVPVIRTGNATDNSPMLSINEAMGFRPAAVFGGWQGAISEMQLVLAD